MSNFALGLASFGVLLLLLALRVPIGVAMLAAGMGGFVWIQGLQPLLSFLKTTPFDTFATICGSSLATAATMGQVALPEMRRYGYSGSLATGTLAAGGTLGILVPPSIPLVVYAILTEQNIAKLFLAAFIPAALAVVGFFVAIQLYLLFRP